MEQNFLSLYKLDTRNKIINFHSSDWVNEISKFFEIIFVILTMQKYMGQLDPCHSNFLKLDLMLKITPLSGMIFNMTPNFTELWWHESNFPKIY